MEIKDMDFERNLRFQRVIFTISSSLAILIIYGILSSFLLILTGIHNINPWAIAASELLFLLVPSIFIIKPLRYKFSDIFRFPPLNIKYFLLSISGFILFELVTEGYLSIQKYLLPASWLASYNSILENYINTIQQLIGKDNFLLLLRSILVIVVVPALSEEFLFRGFMQTTLEKNTKPAIAIILSAVIFGAMHLNPVLFVPLTLAGAYFGYVGYVTKNLSYPIILHFLTNLLSVISYYYQGQLLSSDSDETVPIKFGIFMFTFGLAGLIGLCYYFFRITGHLRKNPLTEN